MTERKPTPKIELVKGSLWLGLKILTCRKVTYTRCPRCRGLIRPLDAESERRYPKSCPYCGEGIGTEDTADSHLALKFLGAGFLFCLIGLTVLSVLEKGQAQVFSHLSCIFAGYLASSLGLTVKPPA